MIPSVNSVPYVGSRNEPMVNKKGCKCFPLVGCEHPRTKDRGPCKAGPRSLLPAADGQLPTAYRSLPPAFRLLPSSPRIHARAARVSVGADQVGVGVEEVVRGAEDIAAAFTGGVMATLH